MIDVIEDERNEFKIKITDKLESEVISFLNTNGGNIFIGVNDDGEVVGIKGNVDLLQRTIKDRLKDNIMPSIIGLYDVVILCYQDKKYIKIVVSRGNEKPYYLKGTGIIRILESYDESAFEFFPNFIRVSFPFNKNKFGVDKDKKDTLLIDVKMSEIQNAIVSLMSDSPTITQTTLAKLLDVNIRTIQRNIKELMDSGIIERTGATKKGEWKIKR